jgi:hypothetical protein
MHIDSSIHCKMRYISILKYMHLKDFQMIISMRRIPQRAHELSIYSYILPNMKRLRRCICKLKIDVQYYQAKVTEYACTRHQDMLTC